MYEFSTGNWKTHKNISIIPGLSYIRNLANELLNFIITDYCHGYIIDIKLPRAIATALRIPQNDPQRQQIRVLKKLLEESPVYRIWSALHV